MILTRAELIERANDPKWHDDEDYRSFSNLLADFALAEIRRAVREELEALRDFAGREREDIRVQIDRRLAALGGNEHDKPGAESQARRLPASERAEGRAASSPCPPPALTDADVNKALDAIEEEVLARAVFILRSRGQAKIAESLSDHIRRAVAPAPKPVDVFEAFALGLGLRAQVRARDWFSPLVEALEGAADQECEDKPSLDNWTCSGCWPCEAKKIISELRRKAQEAGQ